MVLAVAQFSERLLLPRLEVQGGSVEEDDVDGAEEISA